MKNSEYKELKKKLIAIQDEIDAIQTRINEETSHLSDVYEELGYLWNAVISCVEIEPDEDHQGYSYPQ